MRAYRTYARASYVNPFPPLEHPTHYTPQCQPQRCRRNAVSTVITGRIPLCADHLERWTGEAAR